LPRPPHSVSALDRIPGAVFSPVARELGPDARALVPLHVGDTWLEPLVGGRMQDLRTDEHPGLHRYSETRGIPELVDVLVEKARERNRLPCEREGVLVTAGATGALACAVGMLAAPEEEVLILAPFWPLIRGIVQAFRARPVEVPFYDRVDSLEAAVEAVRERVTPRSVALYVSSPSNPTGRVLPRAWLEALAELAQREDLWLLSDEVYEDYVYRGEHFSPGRVAPERTLSVFSFSKAYGMAGNRTGYLVGPAPAVAAAQKVSTHTFYSAPLPPGRRGRGRCAGASPAAGLHLPLPGRAAAAGRAGPPRLPRGLRGRRRGAGARRLLRRGVRGMGAAVLHGGTAGAGQRRRAPPGEAAALTPAGSCCAGSASRKAIHSRGRPWARAPSSISCLYQVKGSGSSATSSER
jgi:N-succinyldiaminopimelate aminotransferase